MENQQGEMVVRGLTPAVAVKKFLSPVSLKEFMDFWKGLTPSERREYAIVASSELGVTLVAPQAVVN